MLPWNEIYKKNPVLTTVILMLVFIVLGVVIDPGLAGLEGLAASTAP